MAYCHYVYVRGYAGAVSKLGATCCNAHFLVAERQVGGRGSPSRLSKHGRFPAPPFLSFTHTVCHHHSQGIVLLPTTHEFANGQTEHVLINILGITNGAM